MCRQTVWLARSDPRWAVGAFRHRLAALRERQRARRVGTYSLGAHPTRRHAWLVRGDFSVGLSLPSQRPLDGGTMCSCLRWAHARGAQGEKPARTTHQRAQIKSKTSKCANLHRSQVIGLHKPVQFASAFGRTDHARANRRARRGGWPARDDLTGDDKSRKPAAMVAPSRAPSKRPTQTRVGHGAREHRAKARSDGRPWKRGDRLTRNGVHGKERAVCKCRSH